MKITLCVSIPNGGGELFRLLARTALLLRSGQNEISFDFTCHSEKAVEEIRSIPNLAQYLGRSYIVEKPEKKFFHVNSVLHSRCIDALYRGVDADIASICDFDIAFLQRGWDQQIVDCLKSGSAFFGTPNAHDVALRVEKTAFSGWARRVQGVPNAMFVAFEPTRIKGFSDRLCNFWEVHSDLKLPVRLIETETDARRYGLRLGEILHVDTGTLIPHLVFDHGLTVTLLDRRVRNYRVLHADILPPDYPPPARPEEYWFNGSPFIAHYRKGATKTDAMDTIYDISNFENDVESWLNAEGRKNEFAAERFL